MKLQEFMELINSVGDDFSKKIHHSLQSPQDTIDGLYYSGNTTLDDQIKLIRDCQYKLLYDSKLDYVSAKNQEEFDKIKYTIKASRDNRASGLGLSCEYFLKYILMCGKLEEVPNISLEDIWNKNTWGQSIRTHDLMKLFNDFFQIIEPNYPGISKLLKELLVLRMQSEDESTYYTQEPRRQLLPVFDTENYYLDELSVKEMIDNHKRIFETARYAMQQEVTYDLDFLLDIAKSFSFIAQMVRQNNNSLSNLDNPLLYIKASLQDENIYNDVLTIRSEDEINELFNIDILKDNPILLYFFLISDKIDMDIIRKCSSISNDEESFINNIQTLYDNKVR